jgi:hypothetical protein
MLELARRQEAVCDDERAQVQELARDDNRLLGGDQDSLCGVAQVEALGEN